MVAYKPKRRVSRPARGRRSIFKKKVTKSNRPTKNLTKLIQAVVSRNIENKSRQANWTMPCIYPQNPGQSYVWYGLFPLTPYDSAGAPAGGALTILQGTGAGSRTGNVIRTKYATLKGVIFPTPKTDQNSSPKPMEVCMWIFKMKNLKDGNELLDAQSLLDNAFFQSGNTVEGVNGNLINIVQAINVDAVHLLHKRVFKVGLSSGDGTTGHPNNDFSLNRKFSINITKYLPKVIKFDDNDDMPNINHTYCFIAPYRADGSVFSGNVAGCTCDWEINYVYEDA